jgi:hypothetical protein
MTRWFTLISVVTAIIAALATGPAFAAIRENTIDPVVTLSADGRQLLVTGPIACTVGDTLLIRITVSQSGTEVVGDGRFVTRCTGDPQQWIVPVTSRDSAAFAAGRAQACALGITYDGEVVTDTRQWCAVDGVTLIRVE